MKRINETWKIGKPVENDALVIPVIGSYKKCVAWIVKDELQEEHANLIAAAPDMLKALEVALEYFKQNGGSEHYTWFEQIQNAVSKAKGQI